MSSVNIHPHEDSTTDFYLVLFLFVFVLLLLKPKFVVTVYLVLNFKKICLIPVHSCTAEWS